MRGILNLPAMQWGIFFIWTFKALQEPGCQGMCAGT